MTRSSIKCNYGMKNMKNLSVIYSTRYLKRTYVCQVKLNCLRCLKTLHSSFSVHKIEFST